MNFKPSCHFLAENFWQEFEHARLNRTVFYFWGHSCEIHTEEDWFAFERKIERLSQEGEWISLPSLFQPEASLPSGVTAKSRPDPLIHPQ